MTLQPQELFQKAIAHHQQGNTNQAISLLEKLNSTSPTSNSIFQLGNFYFQNQQLDQAHDTYQNALDINPFHHLAHFKLGSLLLKLNQPHQALISTFNCLNLKPSLIPARNQVVQTLHLLNLHQLADLFDPQKPLPPSPDLPPIPNPTTPAYNSFANTIVNFFTLSQNDCDFHKLPFAHQLLDYLTQYQLQNNFPLSQFPFIHLTRSQDQSTNLQLALRLAQSIFLPLKLPSQTLSTNQLKLAYLSDGFRNFATSHNLIQVIQHHSPQFQTHAFSYSLPTNDPYHQLNQAAFHHFHQLHHHNPTQIAHLLHRQQIHLAIDLKGHSLHSKLEALSPRPCPIQASFLGYPGTTGADFIDYLITDPIVTPPQSQTKFTEQLAYLPHCYRPLNNTQLIKSTTPKPQPIQLACFSRSYKIEPEIYQVWTNALSNFPQTTLHLYQQNPIASHHLTQTATQAHVSPTQLNFHPTAARDKHLNRLNSFHLSLDTHTVNGHTTTTDSLLAGVPIVTLIGQHFASRVSASVLLAANLSELITHHLIDYQSTIFSLLSKPHKLRRITRKLSHAQNHYPLFDTPRFTHNLESTYLTMWKKHQANLSPHSFHTTDPQPLDNSYIK